MAVNKGLIRNVEREKIMDIERIHSFLLMGMVEDV